MEVITLIKEASWLWGGKNILTDLQNVVQVCCLHLCVAGGPRHDYSWGARQTWFTRRSWHSWPKRWYRISRTSRPTRTCWTWWWWWPKRYCGQTSTRYTASYLPVLRKGNQVKQCSLKASNYYLNHYETNLLSFRRSWLTWSSRGSRFSRETCWVSYWPARFARWPGSYRPTR